LTNLVLELEQHFVFENKSKPASIKKLVFLKIINFSKKILKYIRYHLRIDTNLHVGFSIVECNPSTPDRVLVLISINPCIHYTTEQIVKDVRQALGVKHPVQRADEHSVLWIKTLGRTTDVVGVSDDPRNYLNLFRAHSSKQKIIQLRDLLPDPFLILTSLKPKIPMSLQPGGVNIESI